MTAIRKKLIEVSIPLEAINKASAREKSIRHGHPSTLHLWWARRPLAACRAVLFAQLVDDPTAWPDRFPTKEAQDAERERLHKVIADMAPWDALNDEGILNAARWEIARSVAWGLGEEPPPRSNPRAILEYLQANAPPVYDPFSGGGSIPLEAQRLGLRAYGSDLNPVAVLIGKALVEIPPKFAGQPPVNPKAQAEVKRGGRWNGKGAQGLADDVRYYGEWIRDEAEKRIGHLYSKAKLPNGSEATVIAWLWARTVTCQNPACRKQTPLLSSFVLSSKKGRQRYIVPSQPGAELSFSISGNPPAGLGDAAKGLKRGTSGIFQCLHCGSTTTRDYVAAEGKAGRLGCVQTAVVAEGDRSRIYLPPSASPCPQQLPAVDASALEVELALNPRDVWCRNFGLQTVASLFTRRQLVALTTFSDLVAEARNLVLSHASAALLNADPLPLHQGGHGAVAYSDAIATYLAFVVARSADRGSSICSWDSSPKMEALRNTFARQAIPMTWDFAEGSPFSASSGNFMFNVEWTADALSRAPAISVGGVSNINASANSFPIRPVVISTDPPYYDNIGYADLSDYFYVWHRRTLSAVWPDLFRRLTTPKDHELISAPYRHRSKEESEKFFMDGMAQALTAMRHAATEDGPLTIYYAFKQAEAAADGITSAGWSSFLQAVVDAELVVDGTWPIRTEMSNRMIGSGTNALASSIVLVCRKRPADAGTITRADFIRLLKRELPAAIDDIRKAGVGPVDMQQSVIGPGMGVFSRQARVLEDDDSKMGVKTALAIINRVWGEIENEADAALDAETQVALAWFASYGFDAKHSGDLITLANAKNVSQAALFTSGVFTDLRGRAQLTPREQLPAGWTPEDDRTITVWECVQHTARMLCAEDGGAAAAARLIAGMPAQMAADARQLSDRLFQIATDKGWAAEALVYNELSTEWHGLTELARKLADASPIGPAQATFDLGGAA